MPHLTVRALEPQLQGNESALIAALTDAVADVYGEWARDVAVIHLDGVPAGRWGVRGKPVDEAAPAITFGIRAAAFDRPDSGELVARLVRTVTDAVAGVLGAHLRDTTSVELVATPAGRTAIGGVIVDG
ncbi:Phenylpyruvate tautomerase PptA, 4-oxalocrotonate tautomerase family [Nonomuraea solani]|uniref:Phenylpyruvate tautomerase PptA, 4-oxalocrotonate tautomerase family n=1 Tax=Nonomuraea solani TaxID=1144553 RepID=A0A1H6EM02_9ACTN|nr:tautomerase family protein [Nonomuraea solani]SEG98890.1 Phenylpyruvate tautomerase PptA, 4-oxalocrotonate tautomerase family [Nonomuraea solani]